MEPILNSEKADFYCREANGRPRLSEPDCIPTGTLCMPVLGRRRRRPSYCLFTQYSDHGCSHAQECLISIFAPLSFLL